MTSMSMIAFGVLFGEIEGGVWRIGVQAVF